jgi:hypothetical protein
MSFNINDFVNQAHLPQGIVFLKWIIINSVSFNMGLEFVGERHWSYLVNSLWMMLIYFQNLVFHLRPPPMGGFRIKPKPGIDTEEYTKPSPTHTLFNDALVLKSNC